MHKITQVPTYYCSRSCGDTEMHEYRGTSFHGGPVFDFIFKTTLEPARLSEPTTMCYIIIESTRCELTTHMPQWISIIVWTEHNLVHVINNIIIVLCVNRDQGDEDDYDDRAPQTVNTLGEHWNTLGLLVVNYKQLVPRYYNIVVDRTETSSRLTLGRSATTSIYIIYDKCPQVYTYNMSGNIVYRDCSVGTDTEERRPTGSGKKENTRGRAVAVYSFAYYILLLICTHYT